MDPSMLATNMAMTTGGFGGAMGAMGKIPQQRMRTGGGISSIMDTLKPILLTSFIMKGALGGGGSADSSNQFSTIYYIIALSLMDWIVEGAASLFNILFSFVKKWIADYLSNSSAAKLAESLQAAVDPSLEKKEPTKKASITVQLNLQDTSKSPISHALIDFITNLPEIRSILFSDNLYTINNTDCIQIKPQVFARMLSNSINIRSNTNALSETSSSNSSDLNRYDGELGADNAAGGSGMSNSTMVAKKNQHAPGQKSDAQQTIEQLNKYMEIYSYTLDMEQLREELDKITRDYLVKIRNKLGSQLYYFNELFTSLASTQAGGVDYTKSLPNLHFTMKPFVTNRKFSNLFGNEIAVIRKRVEFFRDNKRWYDQKGIPYTLGILMSGQSGSGKTSTIKCLANELKRHIINVQLTNHMTKTQLDNLFFNEIISVTQNGKTEQYAIPVDKRIYVLEDVDCQCDIVYDRKLTEKKEQEENARDVANRTAQLLNVGPVMGGASTGTHENDPMMRHMTYEQQMDAENRKKIAEQDKNKSKHIGAELKLTLSYLLNLLDGVLETPGRIVIMSANWIDKLDHALIRPGRFDVTAKFSKCDVPMIVQMFQHYYEQTLTDVQIARLCKLTEPFVSPAELSKLLFEYFGEKIEDAIGQLEEKYLEYLMGDSVPLAEPVPKAVSVPVVDSVQASLTSVSTTARTTAQTTAPTTGDISVNGQRVSISALSNELDSSRTGAGQGLLQGYADDQGNYASFQ